MQWRQIEKFLEMCTYIIVTIDKSITTGIYVLI